MFNKYTPLEWRRRVCEGKQEAKGGGGGRGGGRLVYLLAFRLAGCALGESPYIVKEAAEQKPDPFCL